MRLHEGCVPAGRVVDFQSHDGFLDRNWASRHDGSTNERGNHREGRHDGGFVISTSFAVPSLWAGQGNRTDMLEWSKKIPSYTLCVPQRALQRCRSAGKVVLAPKIVVKGRADHATDS